MLRTVEVTQPHLRTGLIQHRLRGSVALAPGVSHIAWLLRGSCFSRDLSDVQRSKHDRVVVLDKTRKLVGFAPGPYCSLQSAVTDFQGRPSFLTEFTSEVQKQALQELTQILQEKCFDKCITRPNGKLDGKQQNCLELCINRYIDMMKLVSETMTQHVPHVRGVHVSIV